MSDRDLTRPPLSSLPSLSTSSVVTAEPAPVFVTTGKVGLPQELLPSTTLKVNERTFSQSDVDWAVVREIRRDVADKLAARIQESGDGLEEADRIQLGRAIIPGAIDDYRRDRLARGENRIPSELVSRYIRAVDSSLFGYGRWQPLMEDPEVENIEIRGYDKVFMVYGDRIERVEPVADSNEELIEQLIYICTYSKTPREFSAARPEITLNLDDRFRLHAMGWVTDRPTIVIRQHKHPDITLDQLVELQMMSHDVARFLTAAVRAKASIVVSGAGGAGKTTFLRALARCLDPRIESIGVIETDPELFLHKIPGFDRAVQHVYEPGSGESIGPNGRPVGEFTLEQHLAASLRQNYSRIFVGEVRGTEATAMLQAMQTGAGSFSTIHARHAEATIERLATSAAAGNVMTIQDAYRQIAGLINLIVHIDTIDRRSQGGTLERFVNQIIEIDGLAEQDGRVLDRPAVNVLYDAEIEGMSGRIRPNVSSRLSTLLARSGYQVQP